MTLNQKRIMLTQVTIVSAHYLTLFIFWKRNTLAMGNDDVQVTRSHYGADKHKRKGGQKIDASLKLNTTGVQTWAYQTSFVTSNVENCTTFDVIHVQLKLLYPSGGQTEMDAKFRLFLSLAWNMLSVCIQSLGFF